MKQNWLLHLKKKKLTHLRLILPRYVLYVKFLKWVSLWPYMFILHHILSMLLPTWAYSFVLFGSFNCKDHLFRVICNISCIVYMYLVIYLFFLELTTRPQEKNLIIKYQQVSIGFVAMSAKLIRFDNMLFFI